MDSNKHEFWESLSQPLERHRGCWNCVYYNNGCALNKSSAKKKIDYYEWNGKEPLASAPHKTRPTFRRRWRI